jgi:hypothetical protein
LEVFKFFVFDHENSQIKKKKLLKLKKCLPTYPTSEGVRYQNHTFFKIWPNSVVQVKVVIVKVIKGVPEGGVDMAKSQKLG